MRCRFFTPTLSIVLTVFFALTGCQTASQSTVTQITDLEYTQAIQTIAAELTQKAPRVTPSAIAAAQQSVTPQMGIVILTHTSQPSETLPPTSTPIPSETSIPSSTPTPEYTATSSLTPEPSWELIYEDDLKLGRWVTEKTESYRLQYSHGGYMISSTIPKEIVYSVRNEQYSNVRVEVSAERAAGPVDGYFGIICNFQNSGNYHFLGIGVDGWYGIGVKIGGQMRYLEEGYDRSGAVKAGDLVNTLQAECANGKLKLRVNEIEIASAADSTFKEGKVGLGVGNREATGMEVVFSDFKVFGLVQP